MRFSQRIGVTPIKVEIQTEYMDDDLRNSLWNIISIYLFSIEPYDKPFQTSKYKLIFNSIWFSFFKEPIDQIPYSTDDLEQLIRKRFFRYSPLEIYDFIDFLARTNPKITPFNQNSFIIDCNKILSSEFSGYRFIENLLTPIINDKEIESIENTLKQSLNKKYNGVYLHLKSALEMLSDRHNPDYRNSIKESISAVESICKQITGDNKAELGKALNILNSIIPIHGALEKGFKSLYGYTSDEQGIRHAMMDEPNLHQEDAMYMLISCSSFINYLMVKVDKLKNS